MQTPTMLPLGATGVVLPLSIDGHPLNPNHFYNVKAEIPTLKAGALTIQVSRDGGVTKVPLLGFVMLTGSEPALTAGATAATFTGNLAPFLGLFLPGVTFYAASATDQSAVAASLTSNHTNALADVTLTAKATGAAGNLISVTYVDPGGAEAALAVSLAGTDISVSLGRTSNALASTAALVEAAINAHTGASALVTAAKEGAGSGICNALAKANLANGWTLPAISLYVGE